MCGDSASESRQAKVAYVFPGQGSQYPGMGRDLAENFSAALEVFEEADDALGFSISHLCFEGPAEELQLTENTQPAILSVSVAALRAMQAEGFPTAHFVAGHSLGEYSALVASRAVQLSDAVRVVRARGRYMQEAVPVGAGAMAAERGAKRVVKLNVSAPFHSALMLLAQERLALDLDKIDIGDAEIPVVVNVDARACKSGSDLRKALVRQVSLPVRWQQSIELLISKGVSSFVEVGPGKVLSGLLRQINRGATGLNVEDSASLSAARENLPV